MLLFSSKFFKRLFHLIHLQICKLQWHAAHVFTMCASLIQPFQFCELVMTNQRLCLLDPHLIGIDTLFERKHHVKILSHETHIHWNNNHDRENNTHTRHNQWCLYFDFHFYVNLFVTCFFFVHVCSYIDTSTYCGKDYVTIWLWPNAAEEENVRYVSVFCSLLQKLWSQRKYRAFLLESENQGMRTKTSKNS